MSKASDELEARRKKRANEDFKRDWWWFDPANHQHIHEFSASWEILRRTRAYYQLHDRMRAICGTIDKNSRFSFMQKGAAMNLFRDMLPQSPPEPSELREMVERWQNMIANGWTPEKNYLEASQLSGTACVLSNGQIIRIGDVNLASLRTQLLGDAWRRRLAIIEYRKPKPEKVIADLDKQILTSEASGVLNWMLAGLDKLRADGWQLNLTNQQQKRVDNLLLESEGHAVFVRECLVRDAEGQLTVPDCFSAYVEFCNQHGWTALTKNKFGSLIGDVVVRQFGITTRNDIHEGNGKAQRGWKGIRRK